MEALHKLKEILCDEIDVMASKDAITISDLDTLHKITDTIKNIEKIEMLENRSSGEWKASGFYGKKSRLINDDDRMMMDQIADVMDSSTLSLDDKSVLKRAKEILER